MIDVARRAGRYVATNAAKVNTIGTQKYVTGSSGLTSNNSADMSRVADTATARPHTTPIPVNANPCFTNMSWTAPGSAPSAMRIPISRVRCDTE